MTKSESDAGRVGLPSLTSMRWYAAFIVFLYHFDISTEWGPTHPSDLGYIGVAFFFTLSGFVLTWSARPDTRPSSFYWNRIARIYPSHIAVFGLLLLAVVLLPDHDVARTGVIPGVLQVFLIQSWANPTVTFQWNGVTWSLAAEAFFYALFPFVLQWSRCRGMSTLRVATLVTLVVGLLTLLSLRSIGFSAASVAYLNPLFRLPEFLLGMWIATELRRGTLKFEVPLWTAAITFGLLGVLCWRLLLPFHPVANYVMLPGFAMLIIAGAQSDRRGHRGLLSRRLPIYLGEVSFAFYLVHGLMIDSAMGIFGWAPSNLVGFPGLVALVTTAGASLIAAVLLHHLVELPARAILVGRRRAKVKSGAAARKPGLFVRVRAKSDEISAQVP